MSSFNRFELGQVAQSPTVISDMERARAPYSAGNPASRALGEAAAQQVLRGYEVAALVKRGLNPNLTRETMLSAEQINGLVANAWSSLRVYAGGSFDYAHVPGAVDIQVDHLAQNNRDRVSPEGVGLLFVAKDVFHRDKELAHLMERDVPELVITGSLEDIIPKAVKVAARSEELSGLTHVFMYETIVDSRPDGPGKFPFPDSFGRSGTNLTYKLFLTESDATQLTKAVRQDPTIARDIALKLVDQQEATGSVRGGMRPPYETWDNLGDGQRQMAFAGSMNPTIDQVQLVSF